MKFAIALVAFLASPSALAADKFDLVCHGTKSNDQNATGEPVDFVFVVDLASKQWCWKHSCNVSKIAAVYPDRLELIKTDDPLYNSSSTMTVDRKSGAFDWEIIKASFPSFYLKQVGTCAPASFSGFPATKF